MILIDSIPNDNDELRISCMGVIIGLAASTSDKNIVVSNETTCITLGTTSDTSSHLDSNDNDNDNNDNDGDGDDDDDDDTSNSIIDNNISDSDGHANNNNDDDSNEMSSPNSSNTINNKEN